MKIEEFKPGRDLDALIAEKVMGWKVIPCTMLEPHEHALCFDWISPTGLKGWSSSLQHFEVPPYSTSIEAAWEVVEKIGQVCIKSPGAPCNGGEYENNSDLWKIEHRPKGMDNSVWAEGETAAHAICLAALAAVEGKR